MGKQLNEGHLQVWLGRRVTPEHHAADWQALADSPRPWAPKAVDATVPLHAHCKLVAAGQHVTVACIVDCATMPYSERLVSIASSGRADFVSKDFIAEELCSRFALYWRHEDLHDAGAILI